MLHYYGFFLGSEMTPISIGVQNDSNLGQLSSLENLIVSQFKLRAELQLSLATFASRSGTKTSL